MQRFDLRHLKNNFYDKMIHTIDTQVKNEEVAKELQDDQLAWVHLDANNKQSKKWLEREVDYLDHLIIDALFAEMCFEFFIRDHL